METRILRPSWRVCVQVVPNARQKVPGVRQEHVDLVAGKKHLGTVIHGLSVQERVVEPARKLFRQQRGLDVQPVELCDRAAMPGGFLLAYERLDLFRFCHAAMPSRRTLATSVLADIGARSKSSSERMIGASTCPSSNPISHAIA